MDNSKLNNLKNSLVAITSNCEMNTRHTINVSSADESNKKLVNKVSNHQNTFNQQIASIILEILNAIEE